MEIILLSGGSGKRLWPLSNNARSKQFIRLLPSPSGIEESMVQRVVRQIKETGIGGNVTVATSAAQCGVIEAQLGGGVDIVTEPERRDTFPAIALSVSYLAMEKRCSDDEVVVVMPCDPFTDDGYFKTLGRMADAVKAGVADLVLMGIRPTYASSKFGYIVPKQGDVAADGSMPVARFTEKPTEERAVELIKEGAVWNGGVFAFRLGYLKEIVSRYITASSFAEVRSRYGEFPKISFDYEVVEKAQSIAVVPFSGMWRDLGTWNALSEELSSNCIGNAVVDNPEGGSRVVNQLGLPLLCIGTSNLIVAASADGILVADKEHSEHIKTFVDKLPQEPRYEEFGWGSRRVVDMTDADVTCRIEVYGGKTTGDYSKADRDRVFTVLSGNGEINVAGTAVALSAGETVKVAKTASCEIKATQSMQIIEVWL